MYLTRSQAIRKAVHIGLKITVKIQFQKLKSPPPNLRTWKGSLWSATSPLKLRLHVEHDSTNWIEEIHIELTLFFFFDK